MAHEDLERWWNGLTVAQRSEALKAVQTGELSEDLQTSLIDAGVPANDHGLSDDVDRFLKARH